MKSDYSKWADKDDDLGERSQRRRRRPMGEPFCSSNISHCDPALLCLGKIFPLTCHGMLDFTDNTAGPTETSSG